MKPTFTLFYTECINSNKDAVCRIITVPVLEGEVQPVENLIVNPESEFEAVVSGLTEAEILSAPLFKEMWPKIEKNLAPPLICASEGNSAKCLNGTVDRLGLLLSPSKFYNAKAICRRGLNEVSYSLDYLSKAILGKSVDSTNPEDIAVSWAELVVKVLDSSEDKDIEVFAEIQKIKPGMMSSIEYVPSLCMKVRQKPLDLTEIPINANPEHPFFGMNVVFTGKLESMTREDARRAVIHVGGIAPERLTKDTNFLVVGEQDLKVVGEKGLSGKMKKAADYKAKGYDIEIINESEFLEILQQI